MTDAVPNPIGVHALVWAGDTGPASVAAAVASTAALGYDLLEFSLFDAEHLDVAAARAELEHAGLGVSCSLGLGFDADVSSGDPKIVEHGAAVLAQALDVTRRLGGTIFTGALYSALGKYPGPLTAAGRRNCVRALRDLAREAGGHDMRIGLEICNRYETNVVNTAVAALTLIDDIGEDNVVIHLDTYHMNIEEDDFVRPVRVAADRLGYVHIGENHRGYLGSGHIDFTGFFHALADAGYTGPVTFESFSTSVVAPGLSGTLAIWRDLWDDGADLARHAHAFIRGQLELAARASGR